MKPPRRAQTSDRRLARLGTAPIVLILASVCAVAGLNGTAASEPPPADSHLSTHVRTPAVESVLHVGMTVGDLDRSVEFYTRVLGFELRSTREATGSRLERFTGLFGARSLTATLALGDEQIELTQYLAPEGRPIPLDSRSNDRWFQHIAIAVSDMDRAYAHLRMHKVRHASSGPQTLPDSLPNAAGISAFYFKDPDGHVLEIIQFPSGKGDPRWQSAATPGRLFLGIDHTAIVVADTEVSLRFYRDALGLTVAGESENHGDEQEHLNNVFGARLRITTLRPERGPGVELLEYLAPAGGRPYPADSQANDLWHWRTTFAANNLAAAAERLGTVRSRWISAIGTSSPRDNSPFMVRDPDGHAIAITPAQSTR